LLLPHSHTPRDLHSFPTRRSSDLWDMFHHYDLDGMTVEQLRREHQVVSWRLIFDDDPDPWWRERLNMVADELATRRAWPHTPPRSEEHTSELQSRFDLVCRLLLEK